MAKEFCFRCNRPVYPLDKVGPLKDGTLFHHGCFKCYICGTRLSLKSYCNNRQRKDDREVYCSNHAPQANAHDPVPAFSNKSKVASPAGPLPSDLHNDINQNGDETNKAVIGDMRIQHALKATEIQKPYPKIVHSGAKYVVDYDQQTRLELIHRSEEDDLYQAFSQQRQEEEQRFSHETKEEWERALNEFAAKYEKDKRAKGGELSPSKIKAKDELIRHLTIKRDKRKETMRMTLKERERSMTSDLVERQSNEMMELFRKARQQVKEDTREMDHKRLGNGHLKGSNGVEDSNGYHHQQSSTSTSSYHYQSGGPVPNNGDTSPVGANGSYPSTPPPPFPPTTSKREICSETFLSETIDKIAVSVAQSEVNSFTDLVRALICNCRNDVEKARAIYRWITIKNLNLMDFDRHVDQDTPMGLLRGIKFGTESYHVLFKRLCSYAGLHCVVIKGYSKSAGYQPGMTFEDGRFRNTWNAVYLDGAWRFVQCNWGARHLVNASSSSNASNCKSPSNGSRNGTSAEQLRYEYDDHYFMTDPAQFIYEFWPRQPEWQLLPTPLTLRQFERLPFVRSLFFTYGLSFADSDASAVVLADKSGAASMALTVRSPEMVNKLIFHYSLKFYDSDKQEFDRVSLKRFVMQSSIGNTVLFRVHAPCQGDYLLDIFANSLAPGEYLSGQPMKFKSVCKCKVVCDRLSVVMVPLPECASGEWGPQKALRLFGMMPLSHEDAIINSGMELEIKFRLTKPLAEFVASLRKNGCDERKLSKLVQQDITDQSTLTFRLRMPDEGQYGLDLYTREALGAGAQAPRGDPNLLTHCCKYLINARL